ncbi:MAG: hypothetical protein V8Q84_06960 [Bilophila sp.]
MKWSICTAVLCAILASVGPAGAERPHEEAKLVKMVILARHGSGRPRNPRTRSRSGAAATGPNGR